MPERLLEELHFAAVCPHTRKSAWKDECEDALDSIAAFSLLLFQKSAAGSGKTLARTRDKTPDTLTTALKILSLVHQLQTSKTASADRLTLRGASDSAAPLTTVTKHLQHINNQFLPCRRDSLLPDCIYARTVSFRLISSVKNKNLLKIKKLFFPWLNTTRSIRVCPCSIKTYLVVSLCWTIYCVFFLDTASHLSHGNHRPCKSHYRIIIVKVNVAYYCN